MSAVIILRHFETEGVHLSLVNSDQLELKGDRIAINRILPLARRYKSILITHLGTASAVPSHVRDFLSNNRYKLTDWSPKACKLLLAQICKACPDFKVYGWCGCQYPATWSECDCLAVQSIYIQSIQACNAVSGQKVSK